MTVLRLNDIYHGMPSTDFRSRLDLKLQLESAAAQDPKTATSIYDFSATDIDGNVVSLEKYRTPLNYSQFAEMHAKYSERGLHILAFPSNQFGKQEPGTDAQIKVFAASYKVRFDMFSKIDINGANAHPLWKWLKEQPNGKGFLGNHIKWNFTKFLINREGQVVFRYGPLADPIYQWRIAGLCPD
ncbi:unnamed protein product [Merluccius merluccius]